MREYIQHEIEKRLSLMPDKGVLDTKKDKMEIAQITFAYNNHELISLLK